MLSYCNKTIARYMITKVFDTIIDIEQYPQFIPWCNNVKIIFQNNNEIVADLTILFNGVRITYTSQIVVSNKIKNHGKVFIEIKMIRGPFRSLKSQWTLNRIDSNLTKINFNIEFLVQNYFLQKIITPIFNNACLKIFNSFTKRVVNLSSIK